MNVPIVRIADCEMSVFKLSFRPCFKILNCFNFIPQLSNLNCYYLNHDGTTISTYDLRDYIQPDFFTNVISTLTDGKNDREFVNEVINLKNQLVSYGTFLESGIYKK